MNTGALVGYPLVDLEVRLVGGSYNELEASDIAYQMAASMAFKEALDRGRPTLLEPIESSGQCPRGINGRRHW